MVTSLKKNSTAASETVSFNAKGKAAIHAEALTIIANGKIAVEKLRPHIAAYRNDKTYADNTTAILEAVRDEVNAYRKLRGDKLMAAVRATRASEFKTCILMADWACCDTVLDYFSETAMTDGDLLTIARYLQANTGKREKAPAKDVLWGVIVERRKNKTGRTVEKGADGKPLPAKPKAVDAKKAIDDTNKLAVGWRVWVDDQPALKKKRVKVNELISTILEAAAALALIAKTETATA